MQATIRAIEYHLPEARLTNEQLARDFPEWEAAKILEKTGIRERPQAASGECASDLAYAAAAKLFAAGLDPAQVDYLLLCTQAPDHFLPTTACLLQDRLGIPTTAGALDFNLGCSGFVYGLSLADGLIRSGAAERVLLITSETYSKYIDPSDRSLRTIFGDGAAATLVEAATEPCLGPFVFGTDGRGADTLIVTEGGARPKETALRPRRRKRWPSSLVMDGPELVKFSLDVVPSTVNQALAAAGWTRDDVDIFLMHQATAFLLNHLRDRMSLNGDQMPVDLEEFGNTVSSTIPILIDGLRRTGRLKPGTRTVMIGFGVGLSWAGCTWTETWQSPHQENKP